MASRISVEPEKLMDTLKATVFKNCTNEEMLALVVVANEYGLNPFLKEIYAFPAKGGGIVPIVSVDGWNKMVVREERFDGMEFEFTEDEKGHPITCTATVYVRGRSKPTKITEFFYECYRKTDNWENMPHRMLRNRTLCQAARMAFGFSGVKHEEEADAINVESTVTTSTPAPAKVELAEGKTPNEQLEIFVLAEGFTFTDFQKLASRESYFPDAGAIGTFAEIPKQDCVRLLRAKTGLLAGLKTIKG